ncbi:MAG: hypothetical protein IIC00_02735 [Planctomycetes bacterium]|nr:hypothetical protein [Planctomycetota bacterium]
MFGIKTENRRQKAVHRMPTWGTGYGKGRRLLFFTLYFSVIFSTAVLQSETKAAQANVLEGIWDPAKYISLDEIKPGMEAYCLTEYGVAGIEKFGLEVVDVVRDFDPGLDVILVRGIDERFIHTGPVAGCSGSPVYIDGRLAGALAYAWTFSKDPLYGVTPIEGMLKVGLGGQVPSSGQSSGQGWLVFDFSKPIDLTEVVRQFRNELKKRSRNLSGVSPLPCLLITSGLTSEAREQLDELFKPFGMMVVAGGGSGSNTDVSAEKVQLVPGACLIVPLVSGDINLAVSGTVTEVRGDKVYGFGHSYLGYGPTDLPMATGKVHTVVSSIYRSFKLASMVETVGALTIDESMAVFGRIGAKAKTIPLTIRIDRYNDTEKRVYNCRVANNRLLTPMLIQSAVSGAAFQLGNFPPDHMIEYKVDISLEGAESISFENVSTDRGLIELIIESIGSVALLMNNPYEEVGIESIDYDIRIVPKSIVSHIWSLDLSDSKLKAGENIEIGVIVESVLAGKKKYQCTLKIPEDLVPGRYDLTVCGSPDYERFLLKAVPYKFIAKSVPGLIEALNYSLGVGRDKLYFILSLPAGGITLEQAELPDLPGTKVLVLQNAKRTLKIQPYQHWIEQSLEIGTVVIDKKVMKITVEK